MIHDSVDKAEQSTYGLRLAARGWRHENWNDIFYPQDLPEDWQLGYYANEFPAVLVPASEWQAGTGFAIEDWQDDVSEHFRFYIEWPFDSMDNKERSLFLQQCQQLGELLGGIILQQDDELQTELAVYYSHSSAEISQQLWQPQHQGQSGVALLELSDQDMRTQRQWLEDFAASTDKLHCVVINDDPVDIESLRNFKTLIELLGL